MVPESMGWASEFIEKLKAGETVQFRPRGTSMSGRVENRQLVTVEPASEEVLKSLRVGDIVLCTVAGSQYLHLVTGIRRSGDVPVSFQIGNNRGRVNGWTPAAKVYGKCVRVET